MEDLTPTVQTDKQPGAGLGAEAMPAAPVLESSGAQQPAEESTTVVGGLGGSKRLASTVDGSAMVPGAMAEAAVSSGAEAGVVDAALESGAGKPAVPEERMALPEASKGVVGHAV